MSHALPTIHGNSGSRPLPPPSTCTTTLMATVRRPGSGGEFVQMSVRWSYTTANPRILTLNYLGRDGSTDRELVRDSVINAVLPGTEAEDQRGDVSVTAVTLAGHGDVVVITLGDPNASAPPTQLVFAIHELVEFLADTEALVPLGKETGSTDTAAVLGSATTGAGPRPDGHRAGPRPRAVPA